MPNVLGEYGEHEDISVDANTCNSKLHQNSNWELETKNGEYYVCICVFFVLILNLGWLYFKLIQQIFFSGSHDVG